jgi:hypothetical protein
MDRRCGVVVLAGDFALGVAAQFDSQQVVGVERAMSETKIKVPEAMKAASYVAAVENRGKEFIEPFVLRVISEKCIEAALRWLLERGVSQDEARDLMRRIPHGLLLDEIPGWFIGEWQRRVFLAPEPEYVGEEEIGRFCARFQRIDDAVREAFRRGQQSK